MNPDVRKCKRCGKLYIYVNSPNCRECNDEIEKCFKKVRDFIFDNDNATMEEIIEGTGVDEDLIFSFLKEGRLTSSNPALGLKCDKCGKPIAGGTMCDACKSELSTTLTTLMSNMSAAEKSAGQTPGQKPGQMTGQKGKGQSVDKKAVKRHLNFD